jgi:hypothetical protein
MAREGTLVKHYLEAGVGVGPTTTVLQTVN